MTTPATPNKALQSNRSGRGSLVRNFTLAAPRAVAELLRSAFRYLDNSSVTSHTDHPLMRSFEFQHPNSFRFIVPAMNGVWAARIGKRSLPQWEQDRT
jgi:hypothetical protein